MRNNELLFTPQAHLLLFGGYSFDRICRDHGVAHRLTKPAHPWTNGPTEHLNRTITEAPVQHGHFQTTDEPHEFLCAQWEKNPAILSVTRPSLFWDYTLVWS